MCPKEQQPSDNLIVKDSCLIIEIFDKFCFSGILRECLSHLNVTSPPLKRHEICWNFRNFRNSRMKISFRNTKISISFRRFNG